MRSRNDASLVLAALVLFAVACSEDDDPTEVPDPPTVSGISASTVAPGDTLVISGANFATPASGRSRWGG